MARRTALIQIQRIGNWNEVVRFFGELAPNIGVTAVLAQKQIARKLKKIVVGHLVAQDLGWEPLSESTLKLKTKNADLILIETEKYLNSIKITDNGKRIMVGVPTNIFYQRTGQVVQVSRVAAWQEYGTKKIPARPLWGPSIEELGGVKGIRDFVATAIYVKLRTAARGKGITIEKSSILKLVTR